MKTFEFELGQRVALKRGVDEVGEVVARMESVNANPQYFVSYTTADGRASGVWFYGSEMVSLA